MQAGSEECICGGADGAVLLFSCVSVQHAYLHRYTCAALVDTEIAPMPRLALPAYLYQNTFHMCLPFLYLVYVEACGAATS